MLLVVLVWEWEQLEILYLGTLICLKNLEIMWVNCPFSVRFKPYCQFQVQLSIGTIKTKNDVTTWRNNIFGLKYVGQNMFLHFVDWITKKRLLQTDFSFQLLFTLLLFPWSFDLQFWPGMLKAPPLISRAYISRSSKIGSKKGFWNIWP